MPPAQPWAAPGSAPGVGAAGSTLSAMPPPLPSLPDLWLRLWSPQPSARPLGAVHSRRPLGEATAEAPKCVRLRKQSPKKLSPREAALSGSRTGGHLKSNQPSWRPALDKRPGTQQEMRPLWETVKKGGDLRRGDKPVTQRGLQGLP